MRLLTVLLLAAAAVLGGCTSLSRGPLPKGEFEANYSATVSTAGVELLTPAAAPAETPAKVYAKLEARFIEIDRMKAREFLGRAPENLRRLDGSPRAFSVERGKIALLLDSLRTREHSRIIGAPRVTCQDRQRASVSLLSDHSYICGFDVSIIKNDTVAEPVMAKIQDGVVVSLRPEIAPDRKSMAIEVQVCQARLQQPMHQIKTAAPGAKGDFALQVPLLKCERLRARAEVPEGHLLVLTGLQAEAGGRVVLVVISAAASDAP